MTARERAEAHFNHKQYQINEQITISPIHVIDEAGEFLGSLGLQAALRIAKRKGLDLVMVSPKAEIPICRFMSFAIYREKVITAMLEYGCNCREGSEIHDQWLSEQEQNPESQP